MAKRQSTHDSNYYKLSLTVEQRRAIAEAYAAGEGTVSLAGRHGTSRPTILAIVRRFGGAVRTVDAANTNRRRVGGGEDELAIVAAYLGGEERISIAKRYACSPTVIYHVLARRGVAMVNRRYKTTPEQRDEIVRRYVAGESPIAIAREFGIDPASIRDIREHRGVAALYTTGTPKRYACDEAAFDDPSSPDVQYWLGMLMADGCNQVRKSRNEKSVSLSLSGDDGHHLEAFRSFLKADSPVSWSYSDAKRCEPNPEGKVAKLIVYSKPLSDSLRKYGVVPRKSLVAKFRRGLQKSRHVWRGMTDGDGWLSITGNGRVQVGLCGSHAIVEQFKQYIDRNVGTCRGSIERASERHARYRVHGNLACDLARHLYGDAAIALPSKRTRANNLLRFWLGETL